MSNESMQTLQKHVNITLLLFLKRYMYILLVSIYKYILQYLEFKLEIKVFSGL